MKMIIWKELRENARWAALAFLCLLLAETYALSGQRVGSYDGGRITLCGSTFLLVTSFGCALIGAALGAVQILPELRRDQWASLLHRPVPRGVIFFGKAIAGLALYALATGLPLIVSIVHVAWPGAFAAPFVPGLAWPAVSDLLLGVVFYFAALLLALHPGRWFGARGAIALAVVAVLVLHLAGRWPFALPVLAAAALLAAGWGAMLGSIRVRPWASRLALGLVILIGLQTALVLLGVFLEWRPPKAAAVLAYEDFQITTDGRVFLMKRQGNGSLTLTDSDGKIITDERYVGDERDGQFLQTMPLAWQRGVDDETLAARGSRRSSWSRVQLITRDSEGPELWYLVRGPQSHFAGYDRLSSRCIGICDAGGFREAAAALRPFAREPQSDPFNFARPYLFWVGPQLFSLDFIEREMTPLFHSGGEAMEGAVSFPYGRETPKYIAVALASSLRILDLNGAPLNTIPYGHDAARWPQLEITSTDDLSRIFLKYGPGYWGTGDKNLPIYLDEIDAQGRLVRTHEMPQNNRVTPPSWRARLVRLLAPPIPTIAATLWERAQPARSASPRPSYPGLMQNLSNREFVALAVVALALGVVGFLWARQASLSAGRTTIWVLLAVVFGVAGLLAYRLASDWPTRVPCPRCARPRSVRAHSCPHCREPWEAAPANHAEIFEPA